MRIIINCKKQLDLDDIQDVEKYVNYLLIMGRRYFLDEYQEWVKKSGQFADHMLVITNRDIKNINIILDNINVNINIE